MDQIEVVEMTNVSAQSVLLLTLDSCRYDTFAAANVPHLKSLGPVHRAMAPSYFTYGSHAAMFVGFTPGIAEERRPFLNPKYGKIFKITGVGFPGKGHEHFALEGRNIVDGFKRKGFRAIGSGAVGWFDPETETGRILSQDFDTFYYPGNKWSVANQVDWLLEQLRAAARSPVFAFLNVGETHAPYFHAGAPWDRKANPCVPFRIRTTRPNVAEDRSCVWSSATARWLRSWMPLQPRMSLLAETTATAGARTDSGSMASTIRKYWRCRSSSS
jgi:hypothetical protein